MRGSTLAVSCGLYSFIPPCFLPTWFARKQQTTVARCSLLLVSASSTLPHPPHPSHCSMDIPLSSRNTYPPPPPPPTPSFPSLPLLLYSPDCLFHQATDSPSLHIGNPAFPSSFPPVNPLFWPWCGTCGCNGFMLLRHTSS
ncbi:uncharacterized protein [Physcomitrium patens]|uniref:uncharacterized protein n=1 Tax=Physcomitrium patens TaxID=3218 RepID=UPI003CCE170F